MRRSTDSAAHEDTGRLGYRGANEPTEGPGDNRLVIRHSRVWRDEAERMTYEHAVEANPIRPGEGHGSYIQRIASIALGKYAGPALKDMPRLPYKEHDE